MGFVIDRQKSQEMRESLNDIINKRKSKVSESNKTREKNNLLLLYYRECLRFSMYTIMNIDDLAEKSLKTIDKMATGVFPFGIPEEDLQKIGVIFSLMIDLNVTEIALKQNIQKFQEEIEKIDDVLDEDTQKIYNRYIKTQSDA